MAKSLVIATSWMTTTTTLAFTKLCPRRRLFQLVSPPRPQASVKNGVQVQPVIHTPLRLRGPIYVGLLSNFRWNPSPDLPPLFYPYTRLLVRRASSHLSTRQCSHPDPIRRAMITTSSSGPLQQHGIIPTTPVIPFPAPNSPVPSPKTAPFLNSPTNLLINMLPPSSMLANSPILIS
jgi:hypothetical protein